MPLSLYLLTWVLVFQSRPLLPHRWMLAAQPFAIVGIIALLADSDSNLLLLNLAAHLLAFFVIAMASHGELARQRPAAAHLTTFYLVLSAGGMVGGLFAGLIAPFAFSWVAEHPILLVIAAARPPVLGGCGRARTGAAHTGPRLRLAATGGHQQCGAHRHHRGGARVHCAHATPVPGRVCHCDRGRHDPALSRGRGANADRAQLLRCA